MQKKNITYSYWICLWALLLTFFTACSSDVTSDCGGVTETNTAISFGGNMSVTSRAAVGSDAATLLGKTFSVYGTKTVSGAEQTVFPNYSVQYTENTANTTSSNTANWEYAHDNQTIKYWDYSATQYSFWAYSNGGGGASVTPSVNGQSLEKVTFSGTKYNLSKCYYTNKQTVYHTAYSQPVTMLFYSLTAKVRIGIYENIPGYSVKDVKFYSSASDNDATVTPTLYSFQATISNGGDYMVSYSDEIKAQVTASAGSYAPGANNLSLNCLSNYSPKENKEADPGDYGYLGHSTNTSAMTDYTDVLPSITTAPLNIKVDYTLVPIDDAKGHQITVKGVTATVPATYAEWKSNYAYTYLFKITDSNLTPITFDAYVITSDGDTQQGTITTIDDNYSITTHQEGDTDGDSICYETNKPIEVSVILSKKATSTTEKVVLSEANETTDKVVIYHQATDNEEVIETTTSDNTTPDAGVYLETIDKYENSFAYFTPDKTGTYRIEFWHKEGDNDMQKVSVKIVKVK